VVLSLIHIIPTHVDIHAGREYSSGGRVRENIIKGVPVSPGISFGRPCYHENKKVKHISSHQKKNLTDQKSSLADAFDRLGDQLGEFAKAAEELFDHDTAAIFKAHRMICEEMQVDVLNTLRQEQLTVKNAVEKCFDDYSEYFNNLSDDYLSDRANDFTELKDLLLNLLENTESVLSCKEFDGCQVGECALKNEHILIANELTANVAIRIRGYTKGIITEKCGINSHAAVIARSLGLPVISGIRDPLHLIHHNDAVLMNGYTGEVVINPVEGTLARYRTLINLPHISFEVVEPLEYFRVMADIDRHENVKNALQVKADGIGLYRTEFEILSKGRMLSEAEQIACYQHVVDSMHGKAVYIRLFDLGSDKSAPWLGIKSEDNPAMECRGARLLLSRPELVKTQARAIAKVSRSAPVNVVYPMISCLDEFLQLRRIFSDAIADIKNTSIRHGIMFEVPSACLQAEELYQVMDFGRIGSNDLVQYLFACDRTHDDYNYHDLANDPAVWKIIKELAVVARKANKPLELCGAMAAFPEFIPKLIELGINTISTGPEYIAAARRAAMSCHS
jgi:phosphoenolpyruvate-protein phosphotransferase (PTS system enzyme I)